MIVGNYVSFKKEKIGNFFYYHYHSWDAKKIEKGLRWKQRREMVGGGGNRGERGRTKVERD